MQAAFALVTPVATAVVSLFHSSTWHRLLRNDNNSDFKGSLTKNSLISVQIFLISLIYFYRIRVRR